MSSIFGGDEPAPQAPQEDPAVVRARQLAEARAQADRIKATQGQLKVETETRQADVTGSRSLLGPMGTLSTRLGAG